MVLLNRTWRHFGRTDVDFVPIYSYRHVLLSCCHQHDVFSVISVTQKHTRPATTKQQNHTETKKLKVHSVERVYLRQRCFDASKPRVAASTGAQYQYVGFSRHNKIARCNAYDSKPGIVAATGAQYGFSRRNKIPRCSAYAMGESNPVPASGL